MRYVGRSRHELRECNHGDLADAWQIYPSVNGCQVVHDNSYSLGSLYNAQLLFHLCNTVVMVTWLDMAYLSPF